jgi:ribA/ribD-fused uncharacterized protein
MAEKIDKFRAENRFLSNFWPAKVRYEGEDYDCVEKAYVAAKFLKETRIVVDGKPVSLRELARDAGGPGQVKRLGKKHKSSIRPDWDDMKLNVMKDLITEKFSAKNPELVEQLLATGDAELIEGNSWGDTFWGVVTGGRRKALIGQGQNNLGKLLMARRQQLREALPNIHSKTAEG